ISDEDLERLSEKVITCESPYIRYGASCCLDQNQNNICDKDEQKQPEKALEPVKEVPSQPEQIFSKLTISEGNIKKISINGLDYEIGVSNFEQSSLMMLINGEVKPLKVGEKLEWYNNLIIDLYKIEGKSAILIFSGTPEDVESLHIERFKDDLILAWKFDKFPNGDILEQYGDGHSEIRVSKTKSKLLN
ncbi:MAG: hypothetical protein AABY22_13440, partial [Nanoarchaeota archaeon]